MEFAKKTTDLVGYVGAPILYCVIWLYYCAPRETAPLAPTVASLLYVLHFLKRCYEVQYVHRYPRAPVGLIDACLEWSYYLGFAAVSPSPVALFDDDLSN